MEIKSKNEETVVVRNDAISVSVKGNSVLVDSRINVEKLPTKYTVLDYMHPRLDRGAIHFDKYDLDPHYYQNGHNGLTIDESVQRAASHVWNTLAGYDNTPTFSASVDEGIVYLIKNNFGRDAAYRIAGGVAKGIREGHYKGVPAGQIFKLIATGEMQPVEIQPTRNMSYNFMK